MKLFDEVEYRREVAQHWTLGIELLPEKPIDVRNVLRNSVKDNAAIAA